MAAKKTIFTIGIAIVTLIVFVFGVATFLPDKASECFPDKFIGTESACLEEGGNWKDDEGIRPVFPGGERALGYCDFKEKCDPIRNAQDRNRAILAFIVGGALLIYGVKGKKLADQTTTGFVAGGMLIIGYGLVVYWVQLTDATRFFVVLGILIALVWIGNKYRNFFK